MNFLWPFKILWNVLQASAKETWILNSTMFWDVFVANQHSYPAKIWNAMKLFFQKKQVVYLLVCLDSDQRIPRMVFHIWFTAGFHSNFSALCAGRSIGNSFSSSWDIGSQHWNGLSRCDIRWAFGMAAWRSAHAVCHDLPWGVPTSYWLRNARWGGDAVAECWSWQVWNGRKFRTLDDPFTKLDFENHRNGVPNLGPWGSPNFAVAHLASFASTESGFFMICLRFLDAVDSCDIRLEASLDTFRILLDTFTICGRRVCASGWSKLPSAPASEQFALIFDFSFGKIGQMQLLPSNCFLHYKSTYINIYIPK